MTGKVRWALVPIFEITRRSLLGCRDGQAPCGSSVRADDGILIRAATPESGDSWGSVFEIQ